MRRALALALALIAYAGPGFAYPFPAGIFPGPIDGGAGTGDVEAVWGCTTGDCSAVTGAPGDTFDATSANSIIPRTGSTSLPVTCTEGQLHADTDSGGSELYHCTATDTWTKVLAASDFDTIAELDAIVADANVIDATEIDSVGEIDTAVSDTIATTARLDTEAEVRATSLKVVPRPDAGPATGQAVRYGATSWEYYAPVEDVASLTGRTTYDNFPANPVVFYQAGSPVGTVACHAGAGELDPADPTELGRKIVWNTDAAPDEAWICTGTGNAATATWHRIELLADGNVGSLPARLSMGANLGDLPCLSSNAIATNGTSAGPNTPCNNPRGMIAIDPTRFGMSEALGGRPDSNGSMYGIDPADAGPCDTSPALGCVDASTDFISFIGQTAAQMTVTFGSAYSGAQNSQSLSVGAASAHTYDPWFCRDTTTPFAQAATDGTCAGGTCVYAGPSNRPDSWIVRKNVASTECLAADVPKDGCTGSGTGTVYRYYPIHVIAANHCTGSGQSLTIAEGLPTAFAQSDSMMVYAADGTHTTAYGHAWMAQLVEEATWEEMFVPRVNLMPNGTMEAGTASGANCNNGTPANGWTFTAAAGTWAAGNQTLDANATYATQYAVYGRSCYGANADATDGSYAESSLIPVVAGTNYTIVGMVKVPSAAAAPIRIVDQAGTAVNPGSDQSVVAAWAPRGNADKDPLTYSATGWVGANPALMFPIYKTVQWSPVVIKVQVPAGVTGLRVQLGRGASATNIYADEFYAYRSIRQNMNLNRIFEDGLQTWALHGDSRNISSTYGIDSSHPGLFGMMDWAHDNGYSNRPMLHWPASLYSRYVSATGGRKISDEVDASVPFSLFKAIRPQYALIQMGLNDVNGAATPAAIEADIAAAREIVASYGSIPVLLLEAPWKGAVGTAAGAQTCSVATTSPDYSGRENNCGNAILSLNRRVLHNGVAW